MSLLENIVNALQHVTCFCCSFIVLCSWRCSVGLLYL